MTKQIVTEYTCDRCFASMPEPEFKRSGGANLTLAEYRDKRKRSSADLCGTCLNELTNTFLIKVAEPAFDVV